MNAPDDLYHILEESGFHNLYTCYAKHLQQNQTP